MPPEITLLGICGSPIKNGNTQKLLERALEKAGKLENVKTKMFLAAKKNIGHCLHCNWCLAHNEVDKYCAREDDLQELFPLAVEADGIIFASPVYTGRLSSYMACIMDRMRCFGFLGRRGITKNKVAGAISVSWYSHGGQETCGLSIYMGALCSEMLPVSVHHSGAYYGAMGAASIGGGGDFDPKDKLGVLKDELALKGAESIALRVVEIARIVKAGMMALTREGTDAQVLSIGSSAREILAQKGMALKQV
ncbi:MAG: flavodoxin family protein [Thermodesulfobacteriota bacterium]|nr:flavodoxin family protein [Thermodesulfobacteriota bacterium]